MKFKPYIVIPVLIVLAFFVWKSVEGWQGINSDLQENPQSSILLALHSFSGGGNPQIKDRIEKIEIIDNSTYGVLMSEAGVDSNISSAIFEAAKDVYDLSKIRVGRTLDLYYDSETDEFKQLVYQIDSEEELFVVYRESGIVDRESSTSIEPSLAGDQIIKEGYWEAKRQIIDYKIEIKILEGELETSLYQWALDNDVDVRAIIELADAYQWTIDFAIDPRVGDKFKFIFEERYRNGEYQMPNEILAAEYINQGQDFQIYYFEEDEEHQGHYDENGVSVQKDLLKAPIHYKYISSGFTTGLRCLSYYSLCTNHRAIDYAASSGTPIRAVGDGTVVFAGWNSGGYGYLTSVRHNDTYTTNYAHQSSILVKYGQKVKQGEIIGKVGSTGLSTGPHLHYEILKHGTKINPLTLELPPGEPIKDENRDRFYQEIEKYQNLLNM